MNDSIVSTSDIRSVLSQQAYVLFYIRYRQGDKFLSFLLVISVHLISTFKFNIGLFLKQQLDAWESKECSF